MISRKSSAKDKSLILNLYKGCGELNGVWGFLVIEVELFRRKMSGAPFEITLFFKITFFNITILNIKELFFTILGTFDRDFFMINPSLKFFR